MSTNSRIGLKIGNGIVSVYHHWDGYPEYLGVKLSQDYTTKEKIAELIDGGDMSSIESDSDWDLKKCEPHVQYYSLRGEDCPPKLAESMTEFFDQCENCGAEYGYIWDNGEWFCYNTQSWDDTKKGSLVDIPTAHPQELIA